MSQNEDQLSATDDHALDELFAIAKANAPVPDAALIGRILADAESVSAKDIGWFGRLRRMLEPVGGLPGMSALAACAVFGLSLGYTGNEGIDGLLTSITQTASFDLEDAVGYYSFDNAAIEDLEG